MGRTRSSDEVEMEIQKQINTALVPFQKELDKRLHAHSAMSQKASSMSQDVFDKVQEATAHFQDTTSKLEMQILETNKKIDMLLAQWNSKTNEHQEAEYPRSHHMRSPVGTGANW
jgi:SMC interacting uncharacterized protein involved in chromosome segregation